MPSSFKWAVPCCFVILVASRSSRSSVGMPFVTLRVTQRFCAGSDIFVSLRSPFRPSATYFDGAKVGKARSSVSGPTSSGSFALTLIRRSLQRAIHGPVQLARRSAEHPPDQCQDSAVTYVAFCVVSAIVVEKHIKSISVAVATREARPLTIVPTLRVGMQFVTFCVTRRFCDVRGICMRLKPPFRPSATHFEGAKVSKARSSVSGPTSSGSFAPTLIRGSPQRAILGPVRLARRPASHPPDQCQDSAVTYVALCAVSAIAIKKRCDYRATLRVACRSGRSASDLECTAQIGDAPRHTAVPRCQ
ncbi:hypothetical protein SAMN05444064_101236 [Pseudomonas syringae]|nr:hypothetical protein SAMN05444514_101238 [Pseudomonas syringae]SFL38815.1 hypothetical protein SAMN05444064_101236 [Pseudomonas syringae]